MQIKKNKIIILMTIIICLLIFIIILLLAKQEKEIYRELENDKELVGYIDSSFTLDSFVERAEINIDLNDVSMDGNYNEVLKKIDSPVMLVAFLNNYFTLDLKDQKLIAKNPEDLFNDKSGSVYDFAHFSAQVLNTLELQPGVIRYDFLDKGKENSTVVVIFRKDNQASYITFNESEVLLFNYHGASFRDLIRAEEARLGAKINRYAYFQSMHNNFEEPIPPFEWIDF